MASNEENDTIKNSNANLKNNNNELTLKDNRFEDLNLNEKNEPNPNARNNRYFQFNDDEKEHNTYTEIIQVGNNIRKREMKIDNFAENNISIRNIIDNALFSQLSEINVKLLDLDESISKKVYNSEGKILPKIDYVEFTLLNQSVNISQFKKYGFGIY